MFIPISASGDKFGLSKAFSLDVFTLVARQPRNSRSWKKIHTSETVSLLAKIVAMMRFFRASVYGSLNGICEPGNITGLPKFWKMKLKADAAYAMVSVPIKTTNPSK